ncbi:MAG: flagellar filament capping protein FliD [Phycisphaerales bacterium]
MGGISLGTGVFSGIDSRSLIDQLLAIEARPKQLAQRRLLTLKNQQAALLDVNSAILGLKTAAGAFRADRVFRASRATSGSEAITATAGQNAAAGVYNFTVARLVSTEQKLSRGFADADVSGLGATEFRFEVGGGRIDTDMRLTELNGGLGVERGKIQITDSAGSSVSVDLSKAVTVNDVLDSINSQGALGVTASVEDDRIVLTDTAGGAGTLTVANSFGSNTATSLGIAGSAVGGVLTGAEVYRLTENTPLSVLNDGLGVVFGKGGQAAPTDFTIDVSDAGGGNLTTYNIILGELGQEVTDPETSEVTFETTEGAVVTLGDLFARISDQTSGEVTGSLSADGTKIVLTAAGGRELTVNEGTNTTTATDLGISGSAGASVTSERIFAGINTRLASNLNGGSGVTAGTFQVTQRDGSSFSVSVTADDTVQDILDKIAGGGANIAARVSSTGNGFEIVDSTTGGSLVITDTTGTAAADLGIATAGDADGILDSGNLQAKWLSRNTRLKSLNAGAGVGTGTLRLTDSTGATSTLEITDANAKTLDDVIRLINARPVGVTASINDTGDGIVIRDTAGGSQALKIEDVEGSVAKKLNLAKSADFEAGDAAALNFVDGSFEKVVTLDPGDTLEEIAQKVNNAGVGVDASVISDGAGPTPFRLIFTSESSGSVGRFVVDTGNLDLNLRTLAEGRDAVVFFGGGDAASSVLLTSPTNSITNVVSGLTIDLNQTTEDPVEVVVTRDVARIEETMAGFVEAYNKVIERISFHERYNSETQEKGALLGDVTVGNVRTSLIRTVNARPIGTDPTFDFLVQVGVRVGEGGKLEFDEERFRSAYEEDPEAVEELLTAFELDDQTEEEIQPGVFVSRTDDKFARLGVMAQIEELADSLTSTIDGFITRRKETLDTQIRLQEGRITQFDAQLANRRTKLEREFLAMEEVIANLQTQQQALASLGATLG